MNFQSALARRSAAASVAPAHRKRFLSLNRRKRRRARWRRGNAAAVLFHRVLRWGRNEDWLAFEKRYGAYLRAVIYRVIREQRIVPSREELEDVTQDVLARLLAQRRTPFGSFADAQLWKYVARATRSSVVSRQRAAARHRGVAKNQLRGFGMDAQELSPEEQAERGEHLRLLARMSRRVVSRSDPQGTRELRALGRVLFEGYSCREVEELSDGAISQKRLYYLLERLRGRLREAGLGTPVRFTPGPPMAEIEPSQDVLESVG